MKTRAGPPAATTEFARLGPRSDVKLICGRRIYFPRQFNNLIESRALGSGRSLARQVKTRVARPSKATPDLSQHVLPLPETLRIKGDVLVLSDRSHATAAEDLFRRRVGRRLCLGNCVPQ